MSATAWCNHFSNILSAFGWPGPGLDSAEHQTFQAWQDVLRSFARAGESIGSNDVENALLLLQQLLGQRRFQPETQQLPVQIIDRHESTGLRADHIWITGMDSLNWPGRVSPDAWLPRQWQQTVGVPGSCAEIVARDASTYWQTWLASATSTVIGSYALERDDQPVVGATFLADLPELTLDTESQDDEIVRVNHALYESLSPQLDEVDDYHGPGIDDGATVGLSLIHI